MSKSQTLVTRNDRQRLGTMLERAYAVAFDPRDQVQRFELELDHAQAIEEERTPHVFVFGQDRKLAYKGSIDNHHQAPFFLVNALDAVLEGKEVQTAVMREGMGEYKVFGCTVKYLTPEERKAKGLTY